MLLDPASPDLRARCWTFWVSWSDLSPGWPCRWRCHRRRMSHWNGPPSRATLASKLPPKRWAQETDHRPGPTAQVPRSVDEDYLSTMCCMETIFHLPFSPDSPSKSHALIPTQSPRRCRSRSPRKRGSGPPKTARSGWRSGRSHCPPSPSHYYSQECSFRFYFLVICLDCKLFFIRMAL